MTDECKHRWKVWSRRGIGRGMLMGERCAKCGADRERPATREEARAATQAWDDNMARSRLMHRAYRLVQSRLKKHFDDPKKYDKYWLADAMDKLATKPGNEMLYVRVDDDVHANSDLWFIPHRYEDPRLGKSYWGTSVLYIGQCSNDPPVVFFCYPHHMLALRDTVQEIAKQTARLNGRDPENRDIYRGRSKRSFGQGMRNFGKRKAAAR